MNDESLDAVVVELSQAEAASVVGKFDPSRWPALTFPVFDDVKTFAVAVSPDCSYRLVKAAMDSAKKSIDFYIYNVSADHLLALLRDAKARHVKIRLMYDVTDTNDNEVSKIAALGVDAREAPSSGERQVFTVCHQKYAVIDGKRIVIESANWATTSIPKATTVGQFKKGNREWLVQIDHAGVAAWFAGLFQKDWDIKAVAVPEADFLPSTPPLAADTVPAAVVRPDVVFDVEHPVPAHGAKVMPITSPDNYTDVIIKLIRKAKKSIWVEQQSIKASGPKTKDILAALAKRKSDCDVRILVSPKYSWDDTVKSLQAAGLDSRLRAMNLQSFTHLHNKGLLFDRETVVVTSTNWTENSVARAREAGVVVTNATVADYYARVFETDWKMSLSPDDVPKFVTAVDALADVLPPDQVDVIHPADLRVDLT